MGGGGELGFGTGLGTGDGVRGQGRERRGWKEEVWCSIHWGKKVAGCRVEEGLLGRVDRVGRVEQTHPSSGLTAVNSDSSSLLCIRYQELGCKNTRPWR
mgnify:CR=1 FL=1